MGCRNSKQTGTCEEWCEANTHALTAPFSGPILLFVKIFFFHTMHTLATISLSSLPPLTACALSTCFKMPQDHSSYSILSTTRSILNY